MIIKVHTSTTGCNIFLSEIVFRKRKQNTMQITGLPILTLNSHNLLFKLHHYKCWYDVHISIVERKLKRVGIRNEQWYWYQMSLISEVIPVRKPHIICPKDSLSFNMVFCMKLTWTIFFNKKPSAFVTKIKRLNFVATLF